MEPSSQLAWRVMVVPTYVFNERLDCELCGLGRVQNCSKCHSTLVVGQAHLTRRMAASYQARETERGMTNFTRTSFLVAQALL